ncbi:hypothetical protein PIB30_021497 [Stylosanthes scabra]|uniref:CCHC-type domain-containing protein n=1 Tax=Stylosanthes scabra TaxID=79078 RepID=A0ABU6Z7X1_9FABA|nr:hypothetical protein [Stylosanthes scabra]
MANKRYQRYVLENSLFRLWYIGYCCVAAMTSFSSAVKFDIEKFDERMIFDLWQVQVKDVLIHSGLHKWKCGKSGHTRRYCPGAANSTKSSEVAHVASVVERYDDIL